MQSHELPMLRSVLNNDRSGDLQYNVKQQGNKSYTNMNNLIVLAHVFVLRVRERTSDRLLDIQFTTDEITSSFTAVEQLSCGSMGGFQNPCTSLV